MKLHIFLFKYNTCVMKKFLFIVGKRHPLENDKLVESSNDKESFLKDGFSNTSLKRKGAEFM